jgi:hypothetical protein
MTNSRAVTADQPVIDQLLADVLASDNWGALMRRYVSASKPLPVTDKLNERQLQDIGLTRANPDGRSKPRRYQGDV